MTMPVDSNELSLVKRSLLALQDLQARLDASEQQRTEPIVDVDSIDPGTNLLDLGIASLEMIRIANLLQHELGARPQICETYKYVAAGPLRCPISAFGGILDQHVQRADVMSWSAETCAGFQARMFPGGDFFLDDVKPRLLQAIADDLARATTTGDHSLHHGGSPS